jgi:hypothetical protein
MGGHNRARSICSQMLKGISDKYPKISEEQKRAFYARFNDLAHTIEKINPQNADHTNSSAFAAVLCKCSIVYGQEKILELVNRMKKGTFTGVNDPASLLWTYLQTIRGLTPNEVYQRVVLGVKAFCEGKTLTRLRNTTIDVFEWNSDFTGPKTKHKKRECKTEREKYIFNLYMTEKLREQLHDAIGFGPGALQPGKIYRVTMEETRN